MSRRVSLPAADDLFRPTSPNAPDAAEREVEQPEPDAAAKDEGGRRKPTAQPATTRKPSGRIRHDEKMTVYVTSDELLDIEHARLALRRTQGMAIDRGRLVRSAIAIALADFEQNGEDSALVHRLRDQ